MNINNNIELFYIIIKYEKFYLPKSQRNNLYLILFKNINFKFIIINKKYRLKIEMINY